MLRRILFMLAASLSFAIMGVFVRAAGQTHLVWKVFFRNLVILMIILATMPPRQWVILTGSPKNRPVLLLRGFFGTLGVMGYFIGLNYLPLANASILNRLNPFFVTILAAMFLGQKVQFHHITALVLAFAGAILVIEPGGGFPFWPTVAALASSLFAGAAYTVIRAIGKKEDPRSVMTWFAAFSLLSTIPLIFIFDATIDPSEIWYLLGVGVFAAGGQGLLTLSYRDGHAGTISAFGYSNVVFAGILGFILYDERASLLFFLGAALIFVSLVLLYFNREREA